MASASSVLLKLSLPKLLQHKIDVLAFNDLDLHIIRSMAGELNVHALNFLSKPNSQISLEALQWKGFEFSDFSLQAIRLDDASILFIDHLRSEEIQAKNVRLRTGKLQPNEPTDFIVSGEVACGMRAVTVDLQCMGEVVSPIDFSCINIQDGQIQLTVDAPLFTTEYGKSQLTSDFSLDTQQEKLEFTNFKLGIPQLLLSGNIQLVNFIHSPQISGHIATDLFVVEDALNHYFNELIPAKDSECFKQGTCSFDFLLTRDNLHLNNVHILCDSTRLHGSFAVNNYQSPMYTFDMSGDTLDFDRYYKIFIVDEPFILEDFGPDFLGSVHSEGRLQLEQVTLAGENFQDFDLSLKTQDGHSDFRLTRALLWNGKASGGVTIDICDKDKQKHPLALSCALHVTAADNSFLPFVNGKEQHVSGQGDATFIFDMPETVFSKNTNIDEVLRYTSCHIQYELKKGTLSRGIETPAPATTDFSSATMDMSMQATAKTYPGGGYGYRLRTAFGAKSASKASALNLILNGSALLSEDLSSVNLNGVKTMLVVSGDILPPGETQMTLRANIDINGEEQLLTASEITLAANTGTVVGEATGHRIFEDNSIFFGSLSFDADPRLVFGLFDTEIDATRDSHVLEKLSGSLQFSCTSDFALFSDIDTYFDDTHLKGKVRVENFDTGYATFMLDADTLDLNRYRPPKKIRIPGKCGEPKVPAIPLPLKTLSQANVDGRLHVNEFRIFDMAFKQLDSRIIMKNGELVLPDLRSEFYQGKMTGSLSAVASSEMLECDIFLRGENFNGGLFMRDVAGKPYVDGKSIIFFDIHTQGATDDAFIANMSGKAGLNIKEGSYCFSNQQNSQKEDSNSEVLGAERTHFDFASAFFNVDHSVFSTDNFQMNAPYIKAQGGGNFNLDADTINLQIDFNHSVLPTIIPIYIRACLHDPIVHIPGIELLGNTVKEVLGLPLKPLQYLRDLLF